MALWKAPEPELLNNMYIIISLYIKASLFEEAGNYFSAGPEKTGSREDDIFFNLLSLVAEVPLR